VAGMSTAGYAAVAAGEDWHYVGEAGEPAFENGWVNYEAGAPALAFRIREAGVVDIAGEISSGTTVAVFTLPEGYRPSARVSIPAMAVNPATPGDTWLTVNTAGVVAASVLGTDVGALKISGQFFLSPPILAGDL